MLKSSITPINTDKRINMVTTITKIKAKVITQGNYPTPLNGSLFSLKEIFGIMNEGRFKTESFYDIVTNPKTYKNIHG